GDDGCRLFGLKSFGISERMDHLNLKPNELSQEFFSGFPASLRPPILDRNIATFDPAEFAQPAQKRSAKRACRAAAAGAEKAHGPQFSRLLRPRRERPCRCAEPRDEIPPSHSITSSASASSVGGMVRPSALAVLRLMTSSNLVTCSTGMSAGFAPRKILS